MSALLLLLLSESVGALQCFKLRIACTDAGQDKFVLGNSNSLNCPSGSSKITQQEPCQAAATALQVPYGGFDFNGNAFPFSCHLRITENLIYGAAFRNDEKANADAQPVCLTSTPVPTGPPPDPRRAVSRTLGVPCGDADGHRVRGAMSALLLLLISESVGALQYFKLRIACTDAGQAKFVYGEASSLLCPPGYSTITSKGVCESYATSVGKSYGSSFTGTFPYACFLKSSTDEILIFGASCQGDCSGKANADAKLVCALNTPAPTGPPPDPRRTVISTYTVFSSPPE